MYAPPSEFPWWHLTGYNSGVHSRTGTQKHSVSVSVERGGIVVVEEGIGSLELADRERRGTIKPRPSLCPLKRTNHVPG